MSWNRWPDVKPNENGKHFIHNGSNYKTYVYWNGNFYPRGFFALSDFYDDEYRNKFFNKAARGKVNWWMAIPEMPCDYGLNYDLDINHNITLSNRAIKALSGFHKYRHNDGRTQVRTLSDLLMLSRNDLKNLPNVGNKTEHEIRSALCKAGYYLMGDKVMKNIVEANGRMNREQ